MITGIASGLISAFLQSGSYVFSRWYINRHKSPFELLIFSQLAMGIFGVLTLPAVLVFTQFPLTPLFWLGERALYERFERLTGTI